MNEYARIITFTSRGGRWNLEEVYFMNKYIASELVACSEYGGSVDMYRYLASEEDAVVAGLPEWHGVGVYYMPTGCLVSEGVAQSSIIRRRGMNIELVLMPGDGMAELAELLESDEVDLNGLEL